MDEFDLGGVKSYNICSMKRSMLRVSLDESGFEVGKFNDGEKYSEPVLSRDVKLGAVVFEVSEEPKGAVVHNAKGIRVMYIWACHP
jgi:hypothetical protein